MPQPSSSGSRKNAGLIVVATVLALLLVAGCAGLGTYLWLNYGSGDADGNPSSGGVNSDIANDVEKAKGTAVAYLDAVNTKDEATAKSLTCERADAGIVYGAFKEESIKLLVVKVELMKPAEAMVTIGVEGLETRSVLFVSVPKDAWCIKH